ncbi:hypothetical protein BT63DRAFT_411961 [Microthyrium microscopicum]|uniref:Uncharacterized protein n=1 Tax=Microthyrium microscopicum TaxID=703497 RepID=A0A6A6UHG7_9PEZI|nr:hypothetical protein BT63DRAFT_411961 [Microthyrium microscopicum]
MPMVMSQQTMLLTQPIPPYKNNIYRYDADDAPIRAPPHGLQKIRVQEWVNDQIFWDAQRAGNGSFIFPDIVDRYSDPERVVLSEKEFYKTPEGVTRLKHEEMMRIKTRMAKEYDYDEDGDEESEEESDEEEDEKWPTAPFPPDFRIQPVVSRQVDLLHQRANPVIVPKAPLLSIDAAHKNELQRIREEISRLRKETNPELVERDLQPLKERIDVATGYRREIDILLASGEYQEAIFKINQRASPYTWYKPTAVSEEMMMLLHPGHLVTASALAESLVEDLEWLNISLPAMRNQDVRTENITLWYECFLALVIRHNIADMEPIAQLQHDSSRLDTILLEVSCIASAKIRLRKVQKTKRAKREHDSKEHHRIEQSQMQDGIQSTNKENIAPLGSYASGDILMPMRNTTALPLRELKNAEKRPMGIDKARTINGIKTTLLYANYTALKENAPSAESNTKTTLRPSLKPRATSRLISAFKNKGKHV